MALQFLQETLQSICVTAILHSFIWSNLQGNRSAAQFQYSKVIFNHDLSLLGTQTGLLASLSDTVILCTQKRIKAPLTNLCHRHNPDVFFSPRHFIILGWVLMGIPLLLISWYTAISAFLLLHCSEFTVSHSS